MSGSRAQLEKILELLLNEQTEEASDMLHEYVVGKAREQYERVLDEDESEWVDDEAEDYEDEIDGDEIGEDEEEDDVIDQSNDFVDDVTDDGGDDEGDELDFDDEGEEGEGDVEDRVEDLEAELDDLRAEFERLMSGDDDMGMDDMGGDDMDMDMDMDMGDEEMMDSVEYDLDEAEDADEELDEEDENLEEATTFSKTDSEQPVKSAKGLKGSEADNNQSPYTNAPKPTKVGADGAKTFHNKDGGDGKKDHGAGVKANTDKGTDHNIDVPHKAEGSHTYGSGAKDGKTDVDGSNKASPYTKIPK